MDPRPNNEAKVRACEQQLVDTIREIQAVNIKKGIISAVADSQLAVFLIADAYQNIEGVGFELLAKATKGMKYPALEFGTEGYNQVMDAVIEVATPYLDALVKRGELTMEEIPQDETGITGRFYWVSETEIMGS